jgi:hypothetical protein
MASAVVRVSDGTNSVDIPLEYSYLSDNTWTSLPGYFSAKGGTWTSSRVNRRVVLIAPDSQVLLLESVPCSASVGYPFDGLKGHFGDALKLDRGGALSDELSYEFLSV